MATKKRIAILTSGGDCPGLNAAIRAVAKAAIVEDYEVLGIQNGWEGFINNQTILLDKINTSGIIGRGGTILGTSRTSPLKIENGPKLVLDRFENLELEALVVLGGEGTLSVTSKLHRLGLPVIGIPKTIDNDVMGTNFSIGFQTAVQIATDALDRLRSTAESHHRVMILETMGRNTGWIAAYAGMANGADAICIPEIPMTEERVKELCDMLAKRNQRGANFSIVVVAEGTIIEGKTIEKPALQTYEGIVTRRFGGVGDVFGQIIEDCIGIETRVTTLGYVQRGGIPVAYDRSLATAFGVKAVRLIKQKKLGNMVALIGNKFSFVPLAEIEDQIKKLDLGIYRTASIFFG
jgi:ATP-dependent phosphofructokinase / diphosphate-dependent phosphofructokinase